MTETMDRHRAAPNLGRAGAISPLKLAHVVLRSAKIEEARDWYVDVLGCEVMFDGGFVCFLSYDDEHHRVALVSAPDAPAPAGHSGLEHVAFTYAGLGDLVATYRRLAAKGIEPYWCINHGPTTSLYYRDPDGNQVELQIDNFDSDDDLNAWMRSGAFAANPIGVEFDPAELSNKFEVGTPATELVERDRDQG